MDDNERKKMFGEYLTNAQLAIINKRHRTVSITEMAVEAGISQPNLSMWKRGERLPDPDNRLRICVYLWKELKEVTSFEILDLPTPDPNSMTTLAILLMLMDAPPDVIEETKNFLKSKLR